MSRIKKRLTNIYSNIVRKHIQSAPFATKVGQHSDDNWNIKVFHVMTFQKMNLVRQGIHSANGKQRQISIRQFPCRTCDTGCEPCDPQIL